MTVGSPVGLKYLETMIAHGFTPSVIILSHTEKLSKMAIQTVKARTNNRFVWKSLEALLEDTPVPVYFTANHNSDLTAKLLRTFSIEVAILGGTGIIKKKLLTIPRIGIVNVHPGILPDYRGCSAVEWALYNNEAVGVTCHFVTEEIDRGEIVSIVPVPIKRGDLYPTVRHKAYLGQAEGLIAGLKVLSRRDYRDLIRPNRGGHYYQPIPEAKLKSVKQMLVGRRYGHYVD